MSSRPHLFVFLYLIYAVNCSLCGTDFKDPFPEDLLSPYHPKLQRTRRSLRYVRECQPEKYGNLTHEEFNASKTLPSGKPFVTVKNLFHEYDVGFMKRQINGHYTVVEDPLRTFSILEPGEIGGCRKSIRATVADTGRQRHCYVAANAGYFRTKNGNCLGNIVSDGRFVLDANGTQNANFGIRKDGTIVTGYLSEEMVLDQKNPFVQLITGVVWLIRNGKVYVDVSKKSECEDLEETGSVDVFVNVLSARTAIGHDAHGRVVVVQVDGRTHHRGMDMHSFAKLLLKFGLVNAINLDGGGSATMVVNGTTVNYPSDGCGQFICPRKVSTVVCFHAPDCDPVDCSGHGQCVMGRCVCEKHWTGSTCNNLECLHSNCSGNGICAQDGCHCSPGWTGFNCSQACRMGTFGSNCSGHCLCYNGGRCDGITGTCSCLPGWTGRLCEHTCPPGRYGQQCSEVCNCSIPCHCDPISGACPSEDSTDSSVILHNQSTQWMLCLSSPVPITPHVIDEYGVREADKVQEYRALFTWFMGVISLCGASILANCILIYLQCNRATKNRRRTYKTRRRDEDEFIFMLDNEL